MRRWKRLATWMVGLLYLGTWLGGWVTYDGKLRAVAIAKYHSTKTHLREIEDAFRELGDEQSVTERQEWHKQLVYESAPRAGVFWCMPVFPGILYADTHLEIGPMNGGGNRDWVLYYGFGCIVLSSKPMWRT